MPQNPIDDKSSLVQVMVWSCQVTSHYLANGDPDLCWHMASLGHDKLIVVGTKVDQNIHFHSFFYPRPVLAFGYCRCLRLCVCVSVCPCVCVCQSRACPHDNSPLVQTRITKFGTKVQKTLVKVPIVFGDDRPWPSRSNLTWKSNFTSFWACPPITHQAFKLESPNLDRKCILALLRSQLILDKIAFDLHLHFQSWNRFFYQIYLRSVCIIFSETCRL